ncbi:MAG: hypothetical protein IJX58_01095 [Clostridia bacterium]|nr:hypothetical protein [Clostridia bacterium]
MRLSALLSAFLVLIVVVSGCNLFKPCDSEVVFNATDFGVSVTNSGEENSRNLQSLIDTVSENGGKIYIPSGIYEFSENGSQAIGSHCIKMRSNVSITGDGEGTVLKPVGNSEWGLDMFYFNDYLDLGEANYLENCSFDSFVIDGSDSSCRTYTSAGKGFMFNLFRNCHWQFVTVKYTDATGFGVDCPIDSSIKNCIAIGCGKAATDESSGASGFGIGYGYSNDEGILISDCKSYGNKKFGFFFEHQGRFNDTMYSAECDGCFTVNGCYAYDNLYNFGGICSEAVEYYLCISENAVRYGFYFENSASVSVIECKIDNCISGVVISNNDDKWCRGEITVSDCVFSSVRNYDVYTEGSVDSLVLTDNNSELNVIRANGNTFVNENNSWN